MQGAIVMVLALSGLGCHNKCCETCDAPAVSSCIVGTPTSQSANYADPASYYSRNYGGYDAPAATSHAETFRKTLYSFVFGHDPDVPTMREIDESVYGIGSGH